MLLDGHSSHCTLEFIQFCDDHLIIPFCLPSHSTHLLQPLDVRIFQPYKHYHTQAIEDATRLGCAEFDKVEFLAALKSIRTKALKESTIRSAFKACGLVPYNPKVVLEKLYQSEAPALAKPMLCEDPADSLPLLPTIDKQSQTANQNPATPLHSDAIPPSDPHTPQSAGSLKRLSDKILSEVDTLSSPRKKQITAFVKGALIQATAGSLAMQHMANTTAAEKARAHRNRAGSKRHLQKGGILYVDSATRSIKDRDAEELRKAQAVIDRQRAKEQRERAAIEKEAERERRAAEKMEKNAEKERLKEAKARERERIQAEKRAAKEAAQLKKRVALKVERMDNSLIDPALLHE